MKELISEDTSLDDDDLILLSNSEYKKYQEYKF